MPKKWNYLYLIYIFQLSFCSIKIFPILEEQIYISNFFIRKSLSNNTHLFYTYQDSYMLTYKNSEKFISKEKLQTPINNREYFYSNKEYIDFDIYGKLNYNSYYKKINFLSNIKLYNYIILKDMSIVVASRNEKGSNYYLSLFYFKYKPSKNFNYFYENENIILSSNDNIHMIDCSNMIFIFKNNIENKGIFLYIIDDKLQNLFFQKLIEEDSYSIIKASHLDKKRDNIIICTSKHIGEVDCYNAKYRDEYIIGDKLKIFSNCEWFNNDNLVLTLIEDNKIAAVCTNQFNIYYSIILFDDDILKFGTYQNIKLPLKNEYKFSFSNPAIITDPNRDIILYFTISEYDSFTEKIGKIYLNETCNSFIMNNINPNEKILLDFENNISEISEEKNKKLYITYIDKEIELYKNEKKLNINTEFNENDKIYIKCIDSYKPLILKYKYEYSQCKVEINIKKSFIYIMNEEYRCLLNPNIKEPNNIIYHDLNNEAFDINGKKFNFTIIFDKKVEKNDLIFYFLNEDIKCEINHENNHKIFCKGNLPDLSSNIYEQDLYVYSKLSCINKIKIGIVKIKDKYLKEIYDIKNLTRITQNMNKRYDPGEKIKKFSIDMISYYYWFSGFSYCDDKMIESGNCCRDEILDEWELIAHKEYRISLVERILKLVLSNYIGSIYERIKAFFENINPYIYNFIILKSKKYKKYIFGFPGTTGAKQLLFEALGSEFSIFDSNEPNIKVEKFFHETFLLIYKDLFSDSIINELNSNSDYQIIFTGHSLGGAIATISSYYYAKNKLSKNEPVLITFGQPRIGNENFARTYMKLIPLVFRVARKGDIVTIIPPSKNLKELKFFSFFHTLKYQMKNIKTEFKNLSQYNFITKLRKTLILILKSILVIIHIIFSLIIKLILQLPIFPHGYCHIGGLYFLNNDKFYQCADFYNEETGHPICNNWEYDSIYDIKDILDSHGYLNFGEGLIKKCQKGKVFWPF